MRGWFRVRHIFLPKERFGIAYPLPFHDHESTLWQRQASTLFDNGLHIVDISKIDFTKLGEKVRFLRQGRGWSLVDLANRSGVSKAYLSDLENGTAGKPNIQYMYAITVALELTLDELLLNATTRPPRRKEKRGSEDLPPGLAQLQQQLKLSDEDVEMLAQVNFRGNRPKDVDGWRFLWETIKLLGERNLPK